MRRGFTLLELLVVMLIILLVSVLVLPTVLTSIGERQIVGAASLLQSALAGARDTAMRNGSPCGLRFLPDPVFPLTYNTIPGQATTGQVVQTKALVSNRWVPMVSGPDYSEGLVFTLPLTTPATLPPSAPSLPPSPPSPVTLFTGLPCLVLLQAPGHWRWVPSGGSGSWNWVVNNPTSWAWNIRVGDKVQIGSTGAQYTVCGPMAMGPSTGSNADLFVNYPSPSPFTGTYPPPPGGSPIPPPQTATPEYLFLVNGQDDNQDGYIDNGWDGVDNNGNNLIDEPAEWQTLTNPTGEAETWLGPLAGAPVDQSPYTITRRLFPDPTARETPLPSSVLLDLTTSFPGSTHERSRLYVNPYTGAVDLKVMPSGELRFDLPYGVPSSMPMDQSKVVFWLADRGDIFDPTTTAGAWYQLPMPTGTPNYPSGPPTLKGNIRILVADQWGRVTTVEPTNFDPTGLPPITGLPPSGTADPEAPYRSALQGQ